MKEVKKKLMEMNENNKGQGYLDTVILILVSIMVIAFAMQLFQVYMTKQKVDTFATELMRVAEISGQVGSATSSKAETLKSNLGINPSISWSKSGRIQLNEEVTVTITLEKDLGLFGEFGSFPVTLKGVASGKGEVYWK
ncbi:MAG: DUF4320 family protein [Eubacteriales bacterium]